MDYFQIQKWLANSTVNRADYGRDLPDVIGKDSLLLMKTSPFNLGLQLRKSTDKVVQIRSISLTKDEAIELSTKLLDLAKTIEREGT